jgi:FAD:protein FMN transferase
MKNLTPVLFVSILLSSCYFKVPTEYKTIHGYTQGTTYTMTFQDREGRDLQPSIEKLLKDFDQSLSSYLPNSIISRVNNNDTDVKLDTYFETAFHKSEDVTRLSNGAFDITVAPLVNAWGFGHTKKAEVDSSYIDSLMQYVGMDKICIKHGKVIKKNLNVQIDVNAIAQGYSVDIISEFLESKGIENYMVEIGGEVRVKGINKKGELWKIGIDKPVDSNAEPGNDLQAIVKLNNKAVSTSGNYRQFYVKDGVKYAHTINPKTGYPILSRLLSASVMANDCMTADAFATVFMVMGLEKSIVYINNQKELDVYLIYSDENGNYQTFMTPGFKESIVKEAL